MLKYYLGVVKALIRIIPCSRNAGKQNISMYRRTVLWVLAIMKLVCNCPKCTVFVKFKTSNIQRVWQLLPFEI